MTQEYANQHVRLNHAVWKFVCDTRAALRHSTHRGYGHQKRPIGVRLSVQATPPATYQIGLV